MARILGQRRHCELPDSRVAPDGAAPLGAQAISRGGWFVAEHRVGLSGDRTRESERLPPVACCLQPEARSPQP
jgi:hypothetical protein